MNKLMVLAVLGLMMVSCVAFISYNNLEEVDNNIAEIYQGPVPQGYDLEHFRKTGETIKEITD